MSLDMSNVARIATSLRANPVAKCPGFLLEENTLAYVCLSATVFVLL